MRRLNLALTLFLPSLVLTATASAAAGRPPSRDALLEQARRCRRILRTSLVDFNPAAAVDRDHGGSFKSLRDGKFAPTEEKFLTLQARQLRFFSTLTREDVERDAAREAARIGFEFLETKMRDPRHDGYVSTITYAGEPKDARNHAYLNAFALYGLVANLRATGEPQALAAAKNLFRALEMKAHDDYQVGRSMLLCAMLLEGLAEDDPKSHDKELEGDWEAVTFIHEGKDDPQAPGKVILSIRGDAMTLKVGDEVRRATVTVDVDKKPHTIDMAYKSGPDKGKTIRGLYEIQGDELRICHGDATKERPAEIASRPGGGYNIGVWRRAGK